MGWLWGKSGDQPSSPPAAQAVTTSQAPSIPGGSARDSSISSKPSLSSASSPRDEDADLHALLHPGFAPTSTSAASDSDANPAADSQYPSTLSCRELFDSAFYCQSFGGQFNNIYRYGGFRSCSKHWAAWRFCMGLKTLSDSERAEQIRHFYKEKEAEIKMGANSENIWKIRSEPVEKAFWKDPDA